MANVLTDKRDLEKLDIFKGPMCLISTDGNNKLTIATKAQKDLTQIGIPLNVVTIAGLYRTGKSYLMNRLAGVRKGFALGNTTKSETKGIWVWCLMHPEQKGQVLTLMDTEGLGDIDKGDQNHDNQLFTLATLLSSTLVYNIMQAFNQDALEKITERNSISIVAFVPSHVGKIKRLYENERRLTMHEKSDIVYSCLESNRECFTFERPGDGRVLTKLEEIDDRQLSQRFITDTVMFTSFIYSCPPKKIHNGELVSGAMFVSLATSYVEAIRSGSVPCVQDAMYTVFEVENSKHVEKTLAEYKKQVLKIQLPQHEKEELENKYRDLRGTAFAQLIKLLVADDEHQFATRAKKDMKDFMKTKVQENETLLVQQYLEALQKMYSSISQKVDSGHYSQPGGYNNYVNDVSQKVGQYRAEQKKNSTIEAERALAQFEEMKRPIGLKIMEEDNKLTVKEREDEVNNLKLQQETQRYDFELKLKEKEVKAMEREKRFQTDMSKEMDKQIKSQLDKAKQEHDRVMKLKDEELERLRREGAVSNERMRTQIQQLNDEIGEIRLKEKKVLEERNTDAAKEKQQYDHKIKQLQNEAQAMKNRLPPPPPPKSKCSIS